MDDAVRHAYDATRELRDKRVKAACYAPFVSMYLNPQGTVLACCKNQTFPLGSITTERLDDIWNGARVGVLREALADYRLEGGCEFCRWQIEAGDHLGVYTRVFEHLPLHEATPRWPAMLEFAISNTCNFECVMCFGELSSSIRANREHLPPLPKVYGDQFFEDLRPYLPHLRMAKFLGGEPFLARECYRVWDMMIEDGLSVPCHVTTNGSQYNERVERVLEALPISLSISLDGATKETVESIRLNARHDELLANLQRFLAYTRRRGTVLSLTYCLMRQNWHEFGDYLLFAEDLGLEVFVNTVIDPSHCSLYTLPPEELLAITEQMEARSRTLLRRLRRNRNVWLDRVNGLRQNATERRTEGVSRVKAKALEARQTGPEDVRHHDTAAWVLIDQGRIEEALEEVRKTSPSDPRYYHVLVMTAYIQRLLRNPHEAETELERAMRLTKRRPEAYLERAWLRFDTGPYEDGVRDALRARELLDAAPDLEASVCDALGCLLARLGRHDEARQAFERLLALRPADPKARVHRGWAHHFAGEARAALEDAEAALVLAPGDEEAVRLRSLALDALDPD